MNLNHIITLPSALLFSFLCSPLHSSEIGGNIDLNNPFPKGPCSFSGNFVQTKIITGLDKKLASTGAFYYHCDSGVIWSTNTPIEETLVFSRSGDNFQIKDQQALKLKSRQSKLLGKLLNSMMSGDRTEIEQQFLINNTESGYELLPKKKSLKRAIKSIQLSFSETDSPAHQSTPPQNNGAIDQTVSAKENSTTNKPLEKINILIKDRKNQLTSITSTQSNVFDLINDNSIDARLEQCITSSSKLACSQLYRQSE